MDSITGEDLSMAAYCCMTPKFAAHQKSAYSKIGARKNILRFLTASRFAEAAARRTNGRERLVWAEHVGASSKDFGLLQSVRMSPKGSKQPLACLG